jgi:hypothetical protein
MRKILITAAAGAALAITPALASKPAEKPDHPTKPPHPAKCKILTVGYNAKGTLVEQSLTQTKGADTTTDTSDDRWSGDVTVNVTKANHKAPKGEVTYTLTDAKVSWYDAAKDGTPDTPVAGDTVRIHGKITKNKKKCEGPTWTYKVRSVAFEQAAPAPAPAAPTS